MLNCLFPVCAQYNAAIDHMVNHAGRVMRGERGMAKRQWQHYATRIIPTMFRVQELGMVSAKFNYELELYAMNEFHMIRVEGASAPMGTLAVEVARTRPWKLVASGVGFHSREFVGRDLFECLVDLRRELEKAGCRLLCAGARFDVFPSGMSRSMGSGRIAYITRLGQPAKEKIDIFADAGPSAIGTVEQQKEFHTKWLHSLIKPR